MSFPASSGPKYGKKSGTGNDHGQSYEVKMNCLMFIRGIRSGSFHLATNLDGAGAFDDVVLQLHSLTEPSKTFFIQLKHKLKNKVQPRAELTSILGKKDFSLLTYFTSYRDDICPQFVTGGQHQIYSSELCNCFFVLYTNSRIKNEPEVSDHQDEILTTSPGGLTFSFVNNRDDDVCTLAQHIGLYHTFLENIHEQVKEGNEVSTIFKAEASKFMDNYKREYLGKKRKGNINIWEMANLIRNNPTLEKHQDHIDTLLTFGDLSGYLSFVERLKVCTRQSTEDNLDVIIKEELSVTLRIPMCYSAILVKSLLIKIHNWWKCESGTYLTEHSPLWNETVEEALHLINQSTLQELKGLGVKFSDCEVVQLKEQVSNSQVVLCLVKGDCTSLTMCKVIEMLERQQCRYVLGQREESLEFWQSSWCPMLAVEYYNDIHNMFSLFLQVLENHSNKRLIVVARESDLTTVEALKRLFPNSVTEVRDNVSLASLDENTQKRILDMDVKFQGSPIPLRKLIHNEKELMEGLQADLLFKILKGRLITIGDNLKPGLKHYIPRTLQREDIVHTDVIKEILLLDSVIVIISGILKEDVQRLVPPKIDVCQFNGHLVPGCRCYFTEHSVNLALVKSQPEDFFCFLKQRESYKIQSCKCKKGVDYYIKCTKSFLWPDNAWDILDRTAIIVDDPGMGKSTLLTHMAQKTRRKNPDVWVVLAELNSTSAYLNTVKVESLNKDAAIDFLVTCAGLTEPFQMLLFKNSVNITGNVVVLVDGFDEICPDYEEVVICILELLLQTSIVKICITSRPNWKQKLEQSLFSIPFTMNEFTLEDQRNFLHQTWTESVPDINRSHLHEFITDILNTFTDSNNGRSRTFMGVPFQTMLVAEVYEQYLKNDDISSPKTIYMDTVQLYEAFFEKKCNVYFVEKRGDDIANPVIRRDNKKMIINIEENHTYAALIAYISSKNLKSLHDKSISRKGLKYLRQEIYEWLMIGFVHSIIEGKPKFLHRTIMEFFVAKWLAKHYDNNATFLKEHLLTDEFSGVRTMFNVIMTQGFNLHTAALNRRLHTLQQAVNEQNINARDKGGRTLLHIAVSTDGDNILAGEMLKFLLDHGANIDVVDAVLQWSAIQYADYIGNWKAMGTILQERTLTSELVFIKSHKVKALIEACRYGFVELLKYLVQVGVDVNVSIDDCKRSAMQVASEHGQLEVIHHLLRSGADVNAEDIYDTTALHLAAKSGNATTMKCLLNARANVNKAENLNGHTALHLGAKNGHIEVVKCLLRSGADVASEDHTGCTPLDLAYTSRHFEIVSCLKRTALGDTLKRTSLIEALRSRDLHTVKLLLGTRNSNLEECKRTLSIAVGIGNVDFVRILVHHLVMMEIPSNKFNSFLHDAVKDGHLAIVEILIENGASVEATSEGAFPPLIVAAFHGHLEIAQFLIEQGCMLEARTNDNMTALHTAVMREHLHIVQLLVDAGSKVNVVNHLNETPLHFAASVDHLEFVKILVEKGSSVNSLNNDMSTPIHVAASKGNINIMRFLINNGSVYDTPNNENMAPLHYAVMEGKLDVVRLLIEKNCAINAPGIRNRTPLAIAAIKGHVNIAQLLITKGAQLETITEHSETPLHYAALFGQQEIARLLIEKGSIVDALNESNMTPLHFAANQGSLGIVQLLVRSGSSVNAHTVDNATAFLYAAEQGHLDTVQYLIEKGSTVDVLHEFNTALMLKVCAEGHLVVLRLLLEKGISVDICNESGKTGLHIAASQGYDNMALLLFGMGCTLDVVDKNGRTPLHYAALQGHYSTAWYLIEMGCKVEYLDRDGHTPLHLAASRGHEDVVRILIEKGSRVNSSNGKCQTPLHNAALNGNLKVVFLLIENGSTVDALDSTNATPLHYASKEGHLDIVNFLIESGCALDILNNELATPLHYAVMKGCIAIVHCLVKRRCATDVPQITKKIPLHFAAIQGCSEMVSLLIMSGSSVNACDENKSTPLHFASSKGHFHTVFELTQRGSTIDALDKDGKTPLHHASEIGSFSIVEHLLEMGALVNARDHRNETPLHGAALQGHMDIVQLLIEKGSVVDALTVNTLTLLHTEVKAGHFVAVQFLIENGCAMNTRDHDDVTALHCAAASGHTNTVEYLIDKGSNINSFNKNHETPLHYAATEGHLKSVVLLIEKGGIVDSFDIFHKTPLHCAALQGHLDISQILIEKGGSVNMPDMDGLTPLHHAAFCGNLDIVGLCIEKGGEVNILDKELRTPLHFSAGQENIAVVRLLIEKGSELNTLTENHNTPLQNAAAHGKFHIVQLLIEKGASINLSDKQGDIALHDAAMQGFLDIVRLLIDNGSPVNSVNNDGRTPLHNAAIQGHLGIVRLLVDKGSRRETADKFNKTPFDLAVENNHEKLLMALQSFIE